MLLVCKVVNDVDQETIDESKDDDDDADESDDVYGVTTVVNFKNHQVGKCERWIVPHEIPPPIDLAF